MDELAGIHQVGFLATMLRRRAIRSTEYRAAGAGSGARGDWSRVRIVLDDQPQLLRDGELVAGIRTLDLRRGLLLSELTYRTPAGITISGTELRLVSMADRAVGLQLMRFSLDRDNIDVRLEANFAMAGLGMEPLRLEPELGAWRTEGSGKAVAMAGGAALRVGGEILVPERPFSLRWVWRWRSAAGQPVELDRIVTVARADAPEEDPTPATLAALERSRALGWRRVLAAHDAAWQARWQAADVVIEGGDDVQLALRFAIYHLTSAANPDDDTVSVGARALTGDAYFGHVFWDIPRSHDNPEFLWIDDPEIVGDLIAVSTPVSGDVVAQEAEHRDAEVLERAVALVVSGMPVHQPP